MHVRSTRVLGSVAFLWLTVMAGCSDSSSEPQVPSPTSLRVEAPVQVTAGEPFSVTVRALGPGGSATLTSFSGTASITSSAGTVSPSAITLSQGEGTAQLTLTGASGAVTLRAAVGLVEGTAAMEVVDPGALLVGAPDAPANTAIPALTFRARGEDYSDDHPTMEGMMVSFNTLLLVLEPATTVAEANEILLGLQAQIVGGIATDHDDVPGHLVLRIPAATHAEMETALSELRTHARVRVALQDALLPMMSALPSNDAAADGWVWKAEPDSGNFGMEMIRAPFMWNVNDKIDARTVTGVLDAGFASNPDLTYYADLTPAGFLETVGSEALSRIDHGTHVAGTIGARHDNNLGVEGVNPFADLVVRPVAPPSGLTGALVALGLMSVIELHDSFAELVRHASNPAVINVSMAASNDLGSGGSPSWNDAWWQLYIQTLGAGFSDLLTTLAADRALPLIVSAAGNNFGVPAQWVSGQNYAALVLGRDEVLVVESVKPQTGGGATLSSFSDVNGDVSAPGGEFPEDGGPQVLSTGHSSLHILLQGTSMAAPHVTGVASFLLSVDPQLGRSQLRELLTAQDNTELAGGGAARRIDGYSALVDIDRLKGNDRVLRMLVDLDDGTEDGNRRTDPDSGGSDYTETDADGDGDIGDGEIDMGDFRRWRDAYLALRWGGLDLTELDGSETHPKKDLNGNGKTESEGDDESLYPRVDLNGDGTVVELDSTRYLGGVFQREVTDLDMIKELFDDPHYQKSELDSLVVSADIAIRPALVLEIDDVVDVHSSIRREGTDEPEDDPKFRRIHTGDEADGESLWQVYTVPSFEGTDFTTPLDYVGRVVGINAQGDTIATIEETFTATPGKDYFWDPENPAVCPAPSFNGVLVNETQINTDKTDGQSSAGYGSLSAQASASPGETDDLKRRWIEVAFQDSIYIVPMDPSRLGTFGRLEVKLSGSAKANYSAAADGPDGASTSVEFGAFSWSAESCAACGGETSETVTISETVGFGVPLGRWYPFTGRVRVRADARLGATAQANGSLSLQSVQVIDQFTGNPMPLVAFCTASGTTYPSSQAGSPARSR